ncbi:MAG: T9SS type A sorting domain-containing protein [Lewinellaceae bacterium]|nr:T9SS type A sorting domain-containing protein [Lewinellaceae bacterium]
MNPLNISPAFRKSLLGISAVVLVAVAITAIANNLPQRAIHWLAGPPQVTTAVVACKADFSVTINPCGKVTFDNASEGNGLKYTWNFGDQSPESGEVNPMHQFAKDGEYRVCLTITDGECRDQICKSVRVVIKDLPSPVVSCKEIVAIAPYGAAGTHVTFETAAPGSGVTWSYLPASGTFFPLGVTEVTKTATDACGRSASCRFIVMVEAGEPNDSIQAPPNRSPGGVMEDVLDRFGNRYRLDDVVITQKSGQILCTSSGYFDLYFEPGCGMDGSSATEIARRNVLCQLFADLSNFIVPVNPSTKVNIWIRDIAAFSPPPGVLGLASSYYVMPSGAAPAGGIADNQIWKTINSGVDAYVGVGSPLNSSGGSGFFHGVMAFNFGSFNWHTNLPVTTAAGLYDLYAVALHEATHALGFASLIDVSGQSKFGASLPYYSRYDLFLRNNAGQPLITNSTACSLYNYQFNPGLSPSILTPNPNLCSDHIVFAGSVNQKVFTSTIWQSGSSLSHLEDTCHVPTPYPDNQYYVMSEANGTGATYMKRSLKPEERLVLCDLGYQVGTSYGNPGQLTNATYAGGTCAGLGVAGVNDGITPTGTYAYATSGTTPITISNVLANDHNAATFECLEVLLGGGTVSTTSGTTFTYTPSSSGAQTVLLRYIPVSSSGKRGNITYVIVRVNNGNCVADPCDLISDPEFDQSAGCGPVYYSNTNYGNLYCWDNLSSSSDLFSRVCTNASAASYTIPNLPGNIYDTWDSNVANLHYMGLWATRSASYEDFESVQTILAAPLIPGQSYTLSFWARMRSPTSPGTNIHVAASPATLAPVSSYSNVLANPNVEVLAPTLPVPGNGQWNYLSTTFTYTGASTLNNLIIGNYPGTTPFPDWKYVYIDNFSLVPASAAVTFTPPTPLCVNQAPVDLAPFASPPGGTFSGPGLTGTVFNPATVGVGIHTVTYSYTNSLGCPGSAFANIQVVNADTCENCCDRNEIIISMVSDDPCCFLLDLVNYCPDEFAGVILDGVGGVQFGSSFTSSTGWVKYQFSSDSILMDAPGTWIPAGTSVSLGTICLDNYSSIPQEIDIIFVDGNYQPTDCRRRIRLECPLVPQDTARCLIPVKGEMTCEDGQYTYTFNVCNYTSPGFTVNYVEIMPAPGFTVTPSVLAIPGGLLPGACTTIPLSVAVTGPGAVAGNNFCFRLAGHDQDITVNPSTMCCTDTTQYCIELPKCCTCEEDLQAVVIPKGNLTGDCCYQLEINNKFCETLTAITSTLLTPGVTYGTVTAQPGWTYGISGGGQSITFQPFPPGNNVPNGLFQLPTFCLNNFGASQLIELKYWGINPASGQGEIICRDTLVLNCPPETVCDTLLNPRLLCLPNGDYQFSFQVMNNSSFTANQIVLLPTTPTVNPIAPIVIPPLAPGATTAILTVVIPASELSGQPQFCLKVKIRDIVSGIEQFCCTNPNVICVPVPECGCTCGKWENFSVTLPNFPAPQQACGKQFTVDLGTTGVLNFNYQCQGGDPCEQQFLVTAVRPFPLPSVSFITSGPTLNLNFPITGTYCVTITPICNGKKCEPCRVCFEVVKPVEKCECGKWSKLFLNDPVNQVSNLIKCDGIYDLECKQNYSLGGMYQCLPVGDQHCEATYNYTLSGPVGFTPVTVTGSPTLNVPLNLSIPGVYTLTILVHCGGQICPCKITFRVKCDQTCTCDKFTDLTITQIRDQIWNLTCNNPELAPLVDCPRPTAPLNVNGTLLCNGCEAAAVNWKLLHVPSNTVTASGTATAPNFSFPLTAAELPLPGRYRLTLEGKCGEEVCRCITEFILPDCGQRDCDCENNLVRNPGFNNGFSFGSMPAPGSINQWVVGTQSPQISNDSCCEAVSVQMWGNQGIGESIRQTGVNFIAGRTYRVRFCARFLDQPNLATKYIRFGFTGANGPVNPFTCGTCDQIGASGNITSSTWTTYTLPDWTPTSNWSDLYVRAFNNNTGDGTVVSWGRIDDICIQDVTPEACVCDKFTGLAIHQSDSWGLELKCDAEPVKLPCFPAQSGSVDLVGKLLCKPDSCEADSKLTWTLSQAGGPAIATGSEVVSGGMFNFPLPLDQCKPGTYEVTLVGHCGQETCRCVIRFTIPDDCCKDCECKGFENLTLGYGGKKIEVKCGVDPVMLACPIGNLSLSGDFLCSVVAGCDQSLDWVLLNQAGGTLASGSATTLPGFGIAINATLISTPGLYTLSLTGHCGTSTCACRIRFIVPECPTGLSCDSLMATIKYAGVVNNKDCCWTISVKNAYPSNTIQSIQLGNLTDAQFDLVQVPAGWTATLVGGKWVITKTSSTFIPPGTYPNLITVCLRNRTAPVQSFTLEWLYGTPGAVSQLICPTKFTTDCPESGPCKCGGYRDLTMTMGNLQYHPKCGDKPFKLGCPASDIKITGQFLCEGSADCAKNLSWKLVAPNGTVTTGTVTGTLNISLSLPQSLLSQPGMYTLGLLGQCGDDKCVCKIRFVVPKCPVRECSCEDYAKDVAAGFSVQYVLPNTPNTCLLRRVTPVALDPCDQVRWTLDGAVVTPTMVGSLNSVINFLTPGKHVLCMEVKRTDPVTGKTCEPLLRYCDTIAINCTTPISTPTTCPETVLKNGTFLDGAVAGYLGEGGALTQWKQHSGIPLVCTGPGYQSDATVVLSGDRDTRDALYLPVMLTSGKMYQLTFAVRAWDPCGAGCLDNQPLGRLKVTAHTDNNGLGESELIGAYLQVAADEGWLYLTLPVWKATRDYRSIVVEVDNDLPGTGGDGNRTFLEIDDICLTPVVPTATRERLLENSVSVFPNPTTDAVLVRFGEPTQGVLTLHLRDLWGRTVRQEVLDSGTLDYRMEMGALPSGIYLLEIHNNQGQAYRQRVVKQ